MRKWHRYQNEIDLIERIHDFEHLAKEYHVTNEQIFKKHLADMKRELRVMQKNYRDRLQIPITKEWRTFCSRDDGELWSEYIVMKDHGETDEQIEQMVDDMTIHSYSMYDCTGQPFTAWIHWSRQPIGIVFIHHKGLDV